MVRYYSPGPADADGNPSSAVPPPVRSAIKPYTGGELRGDVGIDQPGDGATAGNGGGVITDPHRWNDAPRGNGGGPATAAPKNGGGGSGGGPKPSGRTWIPALAGYRALAAFAVLVFHVLSLDSPDGEFGDWLVPMGPAAVATFFVLSGFLVYRPFAAWAFGDGPPISYWRFAVRRSARILPLYWVVLTAHLFVIEQKPHSIDEILTAYTLTQTFRGSMVFVPPFVAWSLSIELWFSFLLPGIAFVLRWLGKRRSWEQRLKIQLFGLGMLGLSSYLFRHWAFQSPGLGRNLWVPAYFDWFGFGLALAVLAHHWSRVQPPPWIKQIADRPWIPLSISLLAYWTITRFGLPVGFVNPTVFQSHFQFGLQSIVAFTIVASATLPGSRIAASKGILASGFFARMGAWSYGLYLIHDMVIDRLLETSPEMNRLLMIVVVTVATLIFAVPLYYLVESPASSAVDWLVKRVPVRPTNRVGAAGSPAGISSFPLQTPAPAPRRADVAVEAPRLASGRFTARLAAPPKTFEEETWLSPNRPVGMTLIAVFMSLAATLAAKPGVYVADSRFEMFADPASRLARMFNLWDPTRDLGRVSEEFWPGLTLASTILSALGADLWLNQRLVHAGLLALAATGAMTLSRTFRPQLGWPTLVVGGIYAFGPFSAVYLVPSPLYVSHVIAPWLVVAVVRGAGGGRTIFWASVASLALLSAGNADPPGLIFACIPALITWVAMMIGERPLRRRLMTFAFYGGFVTIIGSAAMIYKTLVGSVALSQRLLETESVDVVSATTSFSETIRGMGLWLTLFRLAPEQIRTQQLIYTDDTLGVAVTYLPVLAAVGALWWIRTRYALLAATWIIVGTVIASGPHPLEDPSPYGRLVKWLYDNSELAFGFRSTHKAGSIIILGLALLGGWTLAGVAGRGYPFLGRFKWLPALAVIVFVGILARPFWRTPLYDPAFEAADPIPAHWEELGDWFEENPPDGRVLVLPGTTNNGYQWGDVGDDLLDPIVPNRVVASVLPLSTASGADVIQEINRSAVSPDYRQGSFLPLARQLGITQVVIRNDLDWLVQQLPFPTELDTFRSDPDLELTRTFGDPGDGGSPRDYSPIEVYSLASQFNEATYYPPGVSQPPVLVDGASRAALDAAAVGLLDGGQAIRNAPMLDETAPETEAILAETPFVVLTDSLVAERRRINYYRYEEIPAPQGEKPSPWLKDYAEDSFVWPDLVGARVASTLNPWFMSGHPPVAVVDSDPFTYWKVPFFQDRGSILIDFDEPQPDQTFEFDLIDTDGRVGAFSVQVDGSDAPWTRDGDVVSVATAGAFRSVQINIPAGRTGTELIGIREVRFEDPLVPSAELSPRLPAMFEQAGSPDVPAVLLLGSRTPAFASWQRVFRLWNADTYSVGADFVAERVPRGCLDDVLFVDGAPIEVRLRTGANDTGRMVLCDEDATVRFSAGRRVVEMFPPSGVQIGQLELVPEGFDPGVAESFPLAEGDMLEPGGLIVSSLSFDERLRAQIGGVLVESEPVNGLAAFAVPASGGRFGGVDLPEERALDLAWLITGLGLAMAVIGLFVSPVPSRWLIGRSVYRTAPWSLGIARIAEVMVLAAAFALADVWGLAGALVTLVMARFAPWSVAVGLVAAAVIAMASVAAWPTLSGNEVEPTDADFLGRVVIGGLLALVVAVERRRRINR